MTDVNVSVIAGIESDASLLDTGEPKVEIRNIVAVTQAGYDALTDLHDPNTLYIITS